MCYLLVACICLLHSNKNSKNETIVQPTFQRVYSAVLQLLAAVPVCEVRLVQTPSVQDKAPLAGSLLIVRLLLDGKVWYAASWAVPGVRGVGRQTRLLDQILDVKDFSALLQVKGLLQDLQHNVYC